MIQVARFYLNNGFGAYDSDWVSLQVAPEGFGTLTLVSVFLIDTKKYMQMELTDALDARLVYLSPCNPDPLVMTAQYGNIGDVHWSARNKTDKFLAIKWDTSVKTRS